MSRIHTHHPCPGCIPTIQSPGLHPGLVCVDPLGHMECCGAHPYPSFHPQGCTLGWYALTLWVKLERCRAPITHRPPELRNRHANPHECLRCEVSRSAWAVAKRTPGIHDTLNKYAGQIATNGQITHAVTHKCWWLRKQASGGPFWGFWRLRRAGIRSLEGVGCVDLSTLTRGFVRTISPAR